MAHPRYPSPGCKLGAAARLGGRNAGSVPELELAEGHDQPAHGWHELQHVLLRPPGELFVAMVIWYICVRCECMRCFEPVASCVMLHVAHVCTDLFLPCCSLLACFVLAARLVQQQYPLPLIAQSASLTGDLPCCALMPHSPAFVSRRVRAVPSTSTPRYSC